jgi:hypothetical protein
VNPQELEDLARDHGILPNVAVLATAPSPQFQSHGSVTGVKAVGAAGGESPPGYPGFVSEAQAPLYGNHPFM